MDNNLFDFFELLGLSPEDISICQGLAIHGQQTVLHLSRLLSIPRTTIYRRLTDLTNLGVISETITHLHITYQLASVDKLSYLVHQKRLQSEQLNQLFPDIQNQLAALSHQSHGLTKVLYYHGRQAVARMTWETLQTKDLFRGYSSHAFAELMGIKETKIFRDLWNKSGIIAHDIISDSYLHSLKLHSEFDTSPWNNWTSRYLPSKLLNINQTLDVFDNVINIYNWHEGEIFAIQIFNQQLADFHKQLFDLSWSQAKPLP